MANENSFRNSSDVFLRGFLKNFTQNFMFMMILPESHVRNLQEFCSKIPLWNSYGNVPNNFSDIYSKILPKFLRSFFRDTSEDYVRNFFIITSDKFVVLKLFREIFLESSLQITLGNHSTSILRFLLKNTSKDAITNFCGFFREYVQESF